MTQHGFRPFADEVSTTTLDALTLENQRERLSIYGSLQITQDQQGLNYALQLQALLSQAIRYLQTQQLPEQVALKPTTEVDNPFA